MQERVRAILVTPAGTMLAIERIRPGVPPCWVVPGGGVEPTDADREAALARELREEIAGKAEVISLLYVLESAAEQQYFYLARIERWSFADRTGPEFSEGGCGEYVLEEIPLTVVGLDSIDLKPGEIAAFLRTALQTERGLLGQPDRRQSETSR
jgi:ADP-ribose pyrophosphatase YjhB (NUDIX family)